MLTAAEACEQLRVSDKTLRRMITSGELKASKIGGGRWGGQYRIDEADLAAYLKKQTVEVPAAEPVTA